MPTLSMRPSNDAYDGDECRGGGTLVPHDPFVQLVGIDAGPQSHARYRHAWLQACLDKTAFIIRVKTTFAVLTDIDNSEWQMAEVTGGHYCARNSFCGRNNFNCWVGRLGRRFSRAYDKPSSLQIVHPVDLGLEAAQELSQGIVLARWHLGGEPTGRLRHGSGRRSRIVAAGVL